MLTRLSRIIGVTLVLGVLTIGPMVRGLFFWPDEIAAICLVSLGVGLWAYGRQAGGLPFHPLGGKTGSLLLLLVFAYVVQFVWAVYPWGNVDWVLRTLTAWLVFAMLRAEASPTTRQRVSLSVVVSGGAIAVVGLLHLASYYSTDPAVAATLGYGGFSDRLVAAYQYPNAAGAAFSVSLIIAAGLLLQSRNRWLAGALGALSAALSLALLFTLSRGAVAVLVVGLLLWIAGLGSTVRWLAVLRVVTTALLPVLLTLRGVTTAVETNSIVQTGVWIAIAAALGYAGAAPLAHLDQLQVQTRRSVLVGLGTVAVVALALGLYGWMPGALDRLGDLDLRGRNVSLRAAYVKDGLAIAADYPLGSGGWGWSRRYMQYQTLAYTARETHNHYVQTLIESGVFGAIAFVGALLGSIRLAIINRGTDPVRWTLSMGAMVLAMHAAGDFTLSYFSLWLLMWALLASSLPPSEGQGRWTKMGPAFATVVLATTVLSAWLWLGAFNLAEAVDLAEKGDDAGAKAAVTQSLRYDPLNSEGLLLLDSVESLELASQLDPFNAAVWQRLAITYDRNREYRQAYDAALRALSLRPTAQALYESAARAAGLLLDQSLSAGDMQGIREVRATLLRMESDLLERQRQTDHLPSLLDTPALTITPEIALPVGQAQFLAGDFRRAEAYLTTASAADWSYASTADIWLYAIYEREGRTSDQLALASKPWIRFLSQNKTYSLLVDWTP